MMKLAKGNTTAAVMIGALRVNMAGKGKEILSKAKPCKGKEKYA